MIDGPWLSDETRAGRVARLQGIGVTDPKDASYGFGVAKYGQYYLYSGGTPGYNAVVAYDPVAKTTIVALTNLMWESSGGAPVQGLFARITTPSTPSCCPSDADHDSTDPTDSTRPTRPTLTRAVISA